MSLNTNISYLEIGDIDGRVQTGVCLPKTVDLHHDNILFRLFLITSESGENEASPLRGWSHAIESTV